MASVIERTLRGGAGFFTANVVSRGFGFAFVVLASRALGPADFGVLALGLSVMGIARRLAGFGLRQTIPRFLSGDGEKNADRLYGSALLVGSVTSLVVGVFLHSSAPWAASFFSEPALTAPLRVLAVAIVAGVAFGLLTAVLQAQECAWQIAGAQALRGVAKVTLLLPFLLWERTATSASWAVLGAFVSGAVWAGKDVRRLGFKPEFYIRWTDVRKIVRYSAPLMVVGFSYFLGQQADRLMLGWLSDADSVGTYTVASKLAMIVGSLQGALYSIFKPIASEAYRNSAAQEMQKAYLLISKWTAGINGITLITFSAIGPWILWIFGTGFTQGSTPNVLIVLSCFYFVAGWVGPTGPLLQMSDGQRVELCNTTAFIGLNICLNYILIPWYGSIGAAWATLISAGVRNILQVAECWYWYELRPDGKGKVPVFITVIAAVAIIVSVNITMVKVATGMLGILISSMIVINKITIEEKNLISSLFDKTLAYYTHR